MEHPTPTSSFLLSCSRTTKPSLTSDWRTTTTPSKLDSQPCSTRTCPPFFSRHAPENPLSTVVYFTQNGSEPAPEYTFRRPNPQRPESKNKFALALGDTYSQDVIFAEVLIEPEWQQPTLSAAEIRAQNGVLPAPVPLIPDGFVIQLYNPDQQVVVKGEKSTWTGKESWDFELPQQSFRMPSASQLDRQQNDPIASELTPKICFKWKRDSKFSKDMTCYLTGTSLAGKKSKDPDITIALYKQGREPGLTIYEPNLRRVEVEDRKGLEVVLLLGAETIREIYLFPSRDSFNIPGTPPPARRKNSRPIPSSSSPKPVSGQSHTMSGGLGNMSPAATPSLATNNMTPPARRQTAEIDAETKRLQAMVEQEEREREKRDQAEQKRIKKMLEEEDKERRRRDAAVAEETERLRREYGTQGQDIDAQRPQVPPRNSQQLHPNGVAGGMAQPPPRPMSAEPPHNPSMSGGLSSWWHNHGRGGGSLQPQAGPSRRRGDSVGVPNNKVQKKHSVFF
ncbi:hypothetical protein PG985_000805 [Apiospora marii]|uniref:uncharacterized protein n=1 Tax=Apiospora marii TaxID=335849 RepID=UPI00312D5725